MNANFELTYLADGDDWFGPNFGGAEVFTNVRQGYAQACPNVGRLLANLKFTLAMENEIMTAILDEGEEPDKAATAWLKANPRRAGRLARRRDDHGWRRRHGGRQGASRALNRARPHGRERRGVDLGLADGP